LSNGLFVSFSGIDQEKVDQLIATVPKRLIRLYFHDFIDGATLLSEMERHVRECSAFLFIASKAALASCWCKHEIALAQIESITRGIKILVLTLDKDIKVIDLPPWMRGFWISPTSDRLPYLKRRFLDLVETNALKPIYSGDQGRVEKVDQIYLDRLANIGTAPNVLFFTGLESIGRYTTARGLLKKIYENPRYSEGPQIALENPASLEDLYMKLREEYTGPLSRAYESELVGFRALTENQQTSNVVNLIEAICKDEETIFIRSWSGLFDDGGMLLDWARSAIVQCGDKSQIRLVIISTRQPRYSEIASLPNVLHYHVYRLTDAEIDALVRAMTLFLDGKATTPSLQAKASIGGHPMLAKHYAYALHQYGISAEERAVYDTILEQRHMFSEFLSSNNLRAEEKVILTMLSWVPHLDSQLFDEICQSLDVTDYSSHLQELTLASLVEYRGGRYSISGPVRLVFRQFYGGGDHEIGRQVAEALSKRVSDPEALTSETVDLFCYLVTVFGKDLPRNIERIISPTSILRAARTLYRAGRDRSGPKEYGRVVELCKAGIRLTREVELRHDFKRVQARALLRMKRFPEADVVIRELERDGGRQALTVRAQYYRFKGEYSKAIPIYRSVISRGYSDDAILHEYCICLRKVGNYEEVQRVIETFERQVSGNIYLLSTKVALQLGSGEFAAAEDTIRVMALLPDSHEIAAEKEAILIYKETQDYRRALDIIDAAISRTENSDVGVIPDLHATRCVIYCKLGLADKARDDMTIVKSFHRDGEFIAERLAIHILLAQSRARDALASFNKLAATRIDTLLKREILAELIRDPATSIAEKSKLEHEYSDTFVARSPFTEFDF
jgi:tetratricopeptide (TPR) repeat protein